MKKLLTILIMVLLLCACSGGGNNGGGKQDDFTKANKVGYMEFVPEETYSNLNSFTEYKADGTLIEKDIVYTRENGIVVGYAVTPNVVLAELGDLSQFDSFEVNGDKYYTYVSGNNSVGMVQKDRELYAVQLNYSNTAENHEENELENLAATVKFTDKADYTLNSMDMFDINYTVDSSLALASIAINVDQDSAGNVTEKSVTWRYGQDTDNLDFNFVVRVYRNKTLEDVLDADSTYLDETINGVDYKVFSTTEDHPYNYYTQHGNDVYQIRNNGVNSGWFGVERSEESWTAFSNFLNTISFK